MRFSALLIALPLMACGGGAANGSSDGGARTTRDFALTNFTRVASAVPADVSVTTGERFSIRASGNEKLIERLEMSVERGALQIRLRKGGWNWGSQGTATIDVTMPRIEGASIAGAGDMMIDRGVGDFEGGIAGAGDMTIGRIEGGDVRLTISGAGDIAAAGTAQSATFSVAGTGSIRAPELIVRAADVRVAGTGDIAATVDGDADVSIAGVGSVDLGQRARCKVRKAGLGDVKCGG